MICARSGSKYVVVPGRVCSNQVPCHQLQLTPLHTSCSPCLPSPFFSCVAQSMLLCSAASSAITCCGFPLFFLLASLQKKGRPAALLRPVRPGDASSVPMRWPIIHAHRPAQSDCLGSEHARHGSDEKMRLRGWAGRRAGLDRGGSRGGQGGRKVCVWAGVGVCMVTFYF